MIEVKVKEQDLIAAAEHGMDEFLQVFIDGIHGAIGGELTGESMQELNADQVTLLAYQMVRDEVMDGGFVQLIHNGYGPFIFRNPFARMMKLWGLRDLSKLIYHVFDLYRQHGDAIERECSDEEFMGLFEQYPDFDEYDDDFVENEEEWTAAVAQYVDEHLERFATVEK